MDSDNILSILSSLQQAPPPGADAPDVQLPGVAPPNIMQAAAPQPAAPPPQAAASSAEDIYHAADAAAPPVPQPRSSLLDKIGRVADVIATVGGAAPLYQPTLDAREDRTLKLGDHARQVQADEIKLATDKFDLADKHNIRLGQVARGLQAIRAAGGDINAAFPVLAARMDLDPATIQSVGQALATDPTALNGLVAATTDPKYDQSKYGGSVVYGKDANGHLVAYQPSLGNDAARNILPEGVEPVDPLKFVDTGGSVVGVGTRSGTPVRILPKTAKPDTILTTRTSRENNRDTNQTAITIAGMPARATNGTGGTGAKGSPTQALAYLDSIAQGFTDLHNLGALPGDTHGLGAIESAIGRTGIGQKIGEQAGLPAAQKRLELVKNINSLQSEMIQSLPGSATRTKFEQEIQKARLPDPMKMSYSTAQTVIAQLRAQYQRALADLAKEQAARTTPASVTGRPKVKPGWTVVKVQ